MRRINKHRLTKTAAMVEAFKRAADPVDGMFLIDADNVAGALAISRRSVLEIVSALIGAAVLDRIAILPRGSPRFQYRLTGKAVDRRYIEVDKTGEPRIFTPARPMLVPSTPRSPREVGTALTLTAMVCGDPPPGYLRR